MLLGVWALGRFGVAMADAFGASLSSSGSTGGGVGGSAIDQRRFNILINVVRAVGLHPKLAETQHCYFSERSSSDPLVMLMGSVGSRA